MASSRDERIDKALEEAKNQLQLITEFEESFSKRSTDHIRHFFADELENIMQSITSQAEGIRLSGAEVWVYLTRGPGDVYVIEVVRNSFNSLAVQHVSLANLRAQGRVLIPFEIFKDIASKMRVSILAAENDGNLTLGVKGLLYSRAYEITAHYVEEGKAEFTKISNRQPGSSFGAQSRIWTIPRGQSKLIRRRVP